jgi:hypothetical protein
MMNVYRPGIETRPDGQEKYMVLLYADETRLHEPRTICKGRPIDLSSWVPLPVQRNYSVRDNMTKPLGDRCGIDARLDPMVLSRHALDVLRPNIGQLGQVLPLAFDEAEYAFFNITNVVDALDESKSELEHFPSSGRLSRVLRYAFKPEAVRDQLLFKIPQQPGNFAFVTDRFVEIVKANGLTGFGFEKIWTDEISVSAASA